MFFSKRTTLFGTTEEGFIPGAASLHNIGVGHGPEREVFEKMTHCDLKPVKLTDTMSFMFESAFFLRCTGQAMDEERLDQDYWKCWDGISSHFKKE